MLAATRFRKEAKTLCLSMVEEKLSAMIHAFLGKYVESLGTKNEQKRGNQIYFILSQVVVPCWKVFLLLSLKNHFGLQTGT